MSAGAAGAPWRADQRRLALAAVLAVALLALGASVGNSFAYDDTSIIALNPRVHTLDGWWKLFTQSYWPPPTLATLYRPIPMLAYAAQWTLTDGAPWLFHLTNVAIYAGLCALAWRVATALLGERLGLAVALLFAAHPVHVEAVANVVGLAELTMAAGMLYALWHYLQGRETALRTATIAQIGLGYALAAFSKEQGVLLPFVLLAAEVTVVRDQRGVAARARVLAPTVAVLVVVAALYLALRTQSVAEWGDAPASIWQVVSEGTRRWTMLGVVPTLLRLLLWPSALAVEYSPPAVTVYREWSADLIPGLVLAVGLVAALVASWRRVPVAAFGLLLAGIAFAPVSNLVFPTGVMIAERTLLVPSVGMLLALAAWGLAALEGPVTLAQQRLLWGGVALVTGLGMVASATRAPVWKNDEVLFHQAVLDAPQSYRAHAQLGTLYVRTGRPGPGEQSLQRAIALFPDDYGALQTLADTYRQRGLCVPAVPLYQRAVEVYPRGSEARAGLVSCLIGMRRWDDARRVAREGMQVGAQRLAFEALSRVVDSVQATVAPLREPQ